MPAARSRAWIWYFLVLASLTVTSITILIVYNRSQLLKPEQLAEARALWTNRDLRDYDLTYTKSGAVSGRFQAYVRDGQVVYVLMDGRPLEPQQYAYHSMDALFEDILRFLEIDAQPDSPRAYNRAFFDPADGYVRKYVRSVSATHTRLEVTAELQPVSPDQQLKKAELDKARSLWAERAPADYDLRIRTSGLVTNNLQVRARAGAVVSLLLHDRPLEPRLYAYYSMGGLFESIERFLEIDAPPKSGRVVNKAVFDPKDGHLAYFSRQSQGTRKQEISVYLEHIETGR